MIKKGTLKLYYENLGKADFNQQLYQNPNPYRKEFHHSRKRWVMWYLCRYALTYKTKSLLDAGCGDGEYTWLFDGEQIDLHGIDISSSFIERAKKKVPDAKFKIGSLEKLPYKKNQFDTVLCSETLEHVFNYPKSLSEIVRVCNDYLVISVPIERSHPFVRLGLKVLGKKDMIPSEVYEGGKEFEELKGGHLREFTSRQLDNDLIRKGFRIVRQKKIHNSALIAVFFILSEKMPFLNRLSKPIIMIINLIDKLFPWWGLTYIVVARKG